MQVNLFTNSKKIRNVPNDPPILALIPYAQKAKRRGANEKKTIATQDCRDGAGKLKSRKSINNSS
ncbi:TPA: hypothetical protein JD360_01025 [Providencia stuartii]|nr:hypothetical protein [Providencia stuartii]HAU5774165.1 hypothetical protein [Providencia stuartii]